MCHEKTLSALIYCQIWHRTTTLWLFTFTLCHLRLKTSESWLAKESGRCELHLVMVVYDKKPIEFEKPKNFEKYKYEILRFLFWKFRWFCPKKRCNVQTPPQLRHWGLFKNCLYYILLGFIRFLDIVIILWIHFDRKLGGLIQGGGRYYLRCKGILYLTIVLAVIRKKNYLDIGKNQEFFYFFFKFSSFCYRSIGNVKIHFLITFC